MYQTRKISKTKQKESTEEQYIDYDTPYVKKPSKPHFYRNTYLHVIS